MIHSASLELRSRTYETADKLIEAGLFPRWYRDRLAAAIDRELTAMAEELARGVREVVDATSPLVGQISLS